MKRVLVFAAAVAVSISTWFVYSEVTKTRREATYRVAMVPFQHDLPVGASREDVVKYLISKNVNYNIVRFGGSAGYTYEIKIGEEPGNLVCERWNVYVALEFSPADTLQKVHIRKIGTCL